tara:strand:- start:303 stop:533 length:231 start_codon:yes stop_codon:yes gene_type:complete
MKCYSTLFFSKFEKSDDDGSSDSDSAVTRFKFNKKHSSSAAFVNDEASDLQRWAEVLGEKQLYKLEQVRNRIFFLT